MELSYGDTKVLLPGVYEPEPFSQQSGASATGSERLRDRKLFSEVEGLHEWFVHDVVKRQTMMAFRHHFVLVIFSGHFRERIDLPKKSPNWNPA